MAILEIETNCDDKYCNGCRLRQEADDYGTNICLAFPINKIYHRKLEYDKKGDKRCKPWLNAEKNQDFDDMALLNEVTGVSLALKDSHKNYSNIINAFIGAWCMEQVTIQSLQEENKKLKSVLANFCNQGG